MIDEGHCNLRTNLSLYVIKISVSLTKRWNIFSLVILIILFGGTKCIKSGSWFLPFPRRVFKALHRAHLCVLIELALCWRKSVAMCLEWINLLSLAACMLWIMHQSIPPAPSAPPGWPPGISMFFALDGKFPGVGTLELSNPPGVGTKKEGKCPVLRQHCNIFHCSHSQIVPF